MASAPRMATGKFRDPNSVRILLGRSGWTEPARAERTSFEVSLR